jgi:hypothetical protein
MSIVLYPFDVVQAMDGARVVTRDLREVTFLEFNPKLQEPVRVRVQIKGLSAPTTYFMNGRRVLEKSTKHDLFMMA